MRARLYDKVMHWLYGGRQLHDLFNVLVVFERTGEIFLRAGSGLKLRLVDMLQALHDVRHADSYRATLLGSEVIRVDDAYALSMLVRAWDNDPVARALMKDLRFGYVHQPRRRAPVTGWQTNVTQALAHPDFPLVALAVNHLNLATDDSLHMLEIMAKCNKLEDFQFHYRSRVLSDERLEALIHTVSGKPRLYRLALSVEGKLGMQAMQRLLHCTPSLRILEFSADEVYHTATFRHLLEALAENTHVQELRFTEGAITQVHMPAVAAILRRNSTLQQLSICNSPIGDDGLLLMAEALTAHASTRLRGLHLNNVDCTYAGAAALLPMLAVRRCIENVSLDRNFITDDGRLAMERSVEELRHATGRRGRGRRELVVSCENQHELRVLWARTAAARVEDHGDTESEVSN